MSLTMSGTSDPTLALVIENMSEETWDLVRADLEARKDESRIMRIFLTVRDSLRPEDLSRTRVVFTEDFVRSVNERDQRDKPFTLERGAGFVAAKTMAPDVDGMVDLLFHSFWLVPSEDPETEAEATRTIVHLAAHEGAHAVLHHLGTNPFDVHKGRMSFGPARVQFVAMASEQIEEHLAEYLSNQVERPSAGTSRGQVVNAFDAFDATLAKELPAVAEDDPDYFLKGMMVTFEALHILWKSLAYLAAELRSGDAFAEVPEEIGSLEVWDRDVAPFWQRYTELLAKIPMSTDIDIDATDRVVVELASWLQEWALRIGFDHHDTDQGGFFQILRMQPDWAQIEP